MTRKIIRLGDPIEPVGRGGNVIAVSATHFTVEGIPVARVGDACSCHQGCLIAEGDPEHTIDGVPVAYGGHRTSCGRALVATIENYVKG